MAEYGEKTALLGDGLRVYGRRWYILAVFASLALFQYTVWNTFGPLVESVHAVWGWETETISIYANWGSIAFLVFMVPILYMQDISLRYTVLLSSGLMALATTLRCIFLVFPHISNGNFTVLCHISAILNGIAGIVVTAGPAAVSAAWFPPQERVTATSISQMLNNIGGGLSFLIASVMVRSPTTNSTNSNTTSSIPSTPFTNTSSSISVSDTESDLQYYLIALTGPAIAIFLLTLLYFPSKPPSPPSRSSQETRLDFWAGTMELLNNPNSWGIAVVWAIPQAVWNNWCALMVISLTKVSWGNDFLTENWVSHLGLVAVLVGTLTAIMVGAATDHIRGYIKTTIIVLLAAGGGIFSLLTLVSLQVVTLPSLGLLQASIYVLLLIGNACVVSTSPLLFEFGVEKLYPISEGMIGGWLNIWYNIISVFFLGLFSIPNIGTRWLSYVLPFGCFSVIPLIMMIKEESRRRNVDDEEKEDEAIASLDGSSSSSSSDFSESTPLIP